MIAHTCPNCLGWGKRPGPPLPGATVGEPLPCPSCQNGIVWEPGVGMEFPVPDLAPILMTGYPDCSRGDCGHRISEHVGYNGQCMHNWNASASGCRCSHYLRAEDMPNCHRCGHSFYMHTLRSDGPCHMAVEGGKCCPCRKYQTPTEAAKDLREPVFEFAEWMESRLMVYDSTRGPTGWRVMYPWVLMRRLKEQVAQLEAFLGEKENLWFTALSYPEDRKSIALRVALKAADIGNFAMFITDIYQRWARGETP